MKLQILRNIGLEDLKALEASDRTDLTEGNVVDVPQKLGTALLERKLAEPPKIKAVPEPSTLNADEAASEARSPTGGRK